MTSRLALPVKNRFLLLIPFLALPALALDKKDVAGFWTLDIEDAVVNLRSEIHFADNGSFEARVHGEVLGETTDLHGRGTWTIKGEYLVTNANGACVETDGSELRPCEDEPGDDGIDSFKVVGTGPDRELVLLTEEGEEPFGKFQGTARQFTLPDLLGSTALARKALGANRRAQAGVPKGSLLRGIDIFDMRGRNLGAMPGGR